MINHILNIEELNSNSNFEFTFNFSKIKNVHLQSSSLKKINDLNKRKKHFSLLEESFKKNKYIESVELNESGFINIELNLIEVVKYLFMSKKELIGTVKDKEPEKYVFDYGGPNIGKSMHVGHLRPLNIGRALYNIYSISNNECISDIHLGDWGIPIAQILTYCYENNLSIENISINDLKEIYPKASLASEENKEFKKLVNTNLIKLNSKHPEIIADWKIISDLTINNVKSVLSKLGHSFDLFYGESTVIDIIPKMIKDLENKQLVTRDSGALISSEDTNPPVLVLKSDGSYLYMTTDLATVLDREKNISPDNYYYIVDSRQSEHFKQLFSCVKYFQFSKSKFKHIGFGTINDSDGRPFKTRDGEVYPLETLWEDVFNILKEKNEKSNAEILTNSVLVFSDLVVDRRTNYKFDINKFTNTEGKTAIYLQYTRVRIKSLLNNAESTQYLKNIYEKDLVSSEIKLIISLIKFSEIFTRSKQKNEPHHLAEYLYEVCQKFNSFYKDVNILKEVNQELKNRRINISIITLQIIELVFSILGIETVDTM